MANQRPEEFLRELRETDRDGDTSTLSYVLVFLAGFALVFALVFQATPTPSPSPSVPIDMDSILALVDPSDVQSIQKQLASMENFVSTAQAGDDPVNGTRIDAILKACSSLSASLIAHESNRRAFQTSLDDAVNAARANVKVGREFENKRGQLDVASQSIKSLYRSISDQEKLIESRSDRIGVIEGELSEIDARRRERAARVDALKNASEKSRLEWERFRDVDMVAALHDKISSEANLESLIKSAASNVKTIRDLRQEVQAHSVLITESSTKGAQLRLRKMTAESRLKLLDEIEKDVLHGGAVSSLIGAQKQRITETKKYLQQLPPDGDIAEEENLVANPNDESTDDRRKSYRRRMAHLAVEEAEYHLTILNKLAALPLADGGPIDAAALSRFMTTLRAPLIAEIHLVESEIASEANWRKRLALELSEKQAASQTLESISGDEALHSARKKVADAAAHYTVCMQEFAALETGFKESLAKYEAAQSDVSANVTTNSRLESELSELREANRTACDAKESMQLRLSTLLQENAGLVQAVADLKSRYQTEVIRWETLRENHRDAQQAIAASRSSIQQQLHDIRRLSTSDPALK